ncbi:ATP-binding protein [Melioribacteraceae bacterium 4301-Me]|uniref:ATP-binding protein n=1 Tax=Pyranulibacter aquaticus TaxID=3163344 RepID=UPI00359B121D
MNMEKERYLVGNILEDLEEKMVFIGGARQVGKTTLATKIITKNIANYVYYNWDYSPDRKRMMKFEMPSEESLLIFDEIHKYRKWKSFIKGIFDVYKNKYKIIVTGSARLNVYRKGSDSLQGRYHYYTLHPFSVAEMCNVKNDFIPLHELYFQSEKSKELNEATELLLKFGGFPEMILTQSEKSLRRWHNEKIERLFKEDIRDVENLRDINSMKLLGDMLPSKVANQLSINSLRADLEVSHRAISEWLDVLEMFYYHYRIYPYSAKVIRSIKKEPKLYLVDWSEVEDESLRFENMIASHLLKFVQFINEAEGYKIKLFYLRNVDKKEVDFFVNVNEKPWFAVEVKLNDTEPSPNLLYFKERLKIPFLFQVVNKKNVDFIRKDVRVISASKFLSGLV